MNDKSAPAAAPVLGLHHSAYRCRDAEETRHFYEDILGLPLVHVVKATMSRARARVHRSRMCSLK